MTSLFERDQLGMELSLGELGSSSRPSSSILLPLFDSRITCEKPCLFENILEIGIVLKQGL